MSRIGKLPITLPSNVLLSVQTDNVVEVKGPKGVLKQRIASDFKVSQDNGVVSVERPTEEKRHRALHGLYRSLLNNMVTGVTTGYTLQLELVGVGYKANAVNNILELSLGYSHSIYFQVPSEITVATETLKGKNPTIKLAGIDKQLIGHVAAELRSLRKVEPYKGKGVRFVGEVVRRKAGKTAGKGK